MLSYQHAYHAGNLADVQKHALLAWTLDYLTQKDKPLSYIETHAGRGLYDLASEAALKTGEAAAGVTLAEPLFDRRHPYRTILEAVRARYGATATAFDRAQQGTVDRYLRIALEADAGQSDEGLRLALYFQRKAPGVSSVYGLMGDPALYKVVQTALGLPAAYSNTNVDTQAAFIRTKINIEDFKDPAKLESFVTRFAAKWQAANGTGQQAVPQVGLAQPLLASFDNSLLLSMQLLKGNR